MVKNTRKKTRAQRARSIFIFCMLAYPVLHFIISQCLQLNIFYMAFHNYSVNYLKPTFCGWDNFKNVFNLFKKVGTESEFHSWRNAFSIFLLNMVVNTPLTLMFSYLLYVKVKGYKIWRTLIYVPCIISAVVLVLIFRSFVNSGALNTILNVAGLGDTIPVDGWLGPNHAWTMIIIFSIWTGVNLNILYFLPAMNRIPTDLVEAAKLDGASEFQIFMKLIFPLITPTFFTITTVSFTGFIGWFMPAMLMMNSNYGIYGTGTVGMTMVRLATDKSYGIVSAYGLMIMVLAAPITILYRKLGDKFQIDVDY